jgi:hypothetical protein
LRRFRGGDRELGGTLLIADFGLRMADWYPDRFLCVTLRPLGIESSSR